MVIDFILEQIQRKRYHKDMRGNWRVLLFAAFIVAGVIMPLLLPSRGSAAINQQINFQGKLTNPDGTNVTDGTYSIRFRIYTSTAPTDATNPCTANSCQWEETQGSVSVADGIFQVALGSGTALPGNVDFNSSALHLGIKVGSDPEMSPRVQFTAAPYAFNSSMLGGIGSMGYVQLGQNASAQTDGSTNSAIFINKTSTGNQLQLQASGVDVFTVTNAGNLTFGQNAAKTISVAQTASNAAGRDLTVVAGQGGAGASANAGGVLVLQGGAGGGTNGAGGNITLAGGAGTGTGTTGTVVVKNPANSATAFVVQDASSNQLFGVDTSGDQVMVGTASNGSSFATRLSAGNQVTVTANAAPTVDMVNISNTGQAVTTAGVSGLQINYIGGAAAVESSAARVDLTPGTTSGGTWNGFRVVANTTGAVSGVNEYGINLDGPTSPGVGNEVAVSIDANWDAGLQIGSKTSDPAAPATDNIYVYARRVAGRSLLRQKGANGVSFAYQPALFEQAISMVTPTATAEGVSGIGSNAWTVLAGGAGAAPTSTQAQGYTADFPTSNTSGNASYVGQTTAQWFRGNTSGSNGFFYVARLYYPDANYGAGATGSRIWTGLTSAALGTTMTNSDNPAGNFAGFQYSTNRGDVNWQFMTKDNTTQNVINTTMAFTVNKLYDFYVYTAPQGATVFWRIDNLTDGTTQEGSTTNNLPTSTVALRAVSQLQTLTTTSRDFRLAKMYVESDR
jgi:hypothetical protein